MKQITKILIANRGEIAVRIFRACHELGIKAVAVYSEADRRAMHVREADEAYLIGPAAASQSYLVQEKLIEVAKKSGSDAIHPGYGFLAENSAFARFVNDSGLIYIGSSPESIQLLGDKVESRQTMAKAGIPLTPGITSHESLSIDVLIRESDRIGYPVLVKAAGGGGGKGMRIVNDPADLKSAIEGASREAQNAFGNPTVYVEKFIVEPRHIEFQVFGDTHGNFIHLNERECSVQRRHQKILEESPSIALDNDLRRRMGETAVKVAQTAGYFNAGTVEFLLDKNRDFYFLEVNTRIQVEHPVTEEVLCVDLVKEQIRVAAGAELSWSQGDLQQRGHTIEARIYAEDAESGFLPAPGPVHFLSAPNGPGIRWDGGVETSDEVSVYYDPMIAKLIVSAETRSDALTRLKQALDRTVILGLTTNIEFLKSVITHPEFVAGNLTTNFLAKHIPEWEPNPITAEEMAFAATLAYLSNSRRQNSTNAEASSETPDPWQTLGAWQIASGGN